MMTRSAQGQNISTLDSTERILAEGIALIIALGSVAFLGWWNKHRNVTDYIEPALTS